MYPRADRQVEGEATKECKVGDGGEANWNGGRVDRVDVLHPLLAVY